MYKWSKGVWCPIIHFTMLQDLLENPKKTDKFIAELNTILDMAFEKDSTIFQQKDLVHGNTLLLAALQGGLFEVVRKIGKMVNKFKIKI